MARRECRTAGVKSGPKSSNDCCGTWKRCALARVAPGRPYRKAGQEQQHWEGRRSQGRSVMLRICPRRPGLSWQEHKQNQREERKANDGSARSWCVFRPHRELEGYRLDSSPGTGSSAAGAYCQGNQTRPIPQGFGLAVAADKLARRQIAGGPASDNQPGR